MKKSFYDEMWDLIDDKIINCASCQEIGHLCYDHYDQWDELFIKHNIDNTSEHSVSATRKKSPVM